MRGKFCVCFGVVSFGYSMCFAREKEETEERPQ